MIIGNNVSLRMLKQDDLDEVIPLLGDLSQRGEYLSIDLLNEVKFRKRFQETGFCNEDHGMFLITDKTGRILGDIAYFKGVSYLPGYEIGYKIYQREDWGKGYTSEALKLFSSYLFDVNHTIHRLELHADMNNIGSRRVAEKAGFTFEGTKRQAVFSRGQYRDLAIYSMLRQECPGLQI